MQRTFLCACFLILAAILLPSCGESHGSRTNIQTEFERDSGFKFPATATDPKIIASDSDFHGDYSMALTFVIDPKDIPAFSSIPASAWKHPENFKPLPTARNLLNGDSSMGRDPAFIVPVGSLLLEQNGPKAVIRIYALDPANGRVFYYRATW